MNKRQQLSTAFLGSAAIALMLTTPIEARPRMPVTLKPDAYTTAPDLIPSNVPTCSGANFVSGFQIVGGGKIT